jgi:hypothetical protein
MNEDLPNLGNEVISHRALLRAHQRLELALTQNGPNIAIYGDYGVGKTTLLRSFTEQQERIRGNVPTESVVLYVPVPFRPTITSLAQRILCEFGHPFVPRSTEATTCARLIGAMRCAGIHLLLLDDFIHVGNCVTQRSMVQITEWLIHLTSATGSRVVVAGPPSCSDLVDQSPRVASRLGDPIRLERFSWDKPESRQDFIAILRSFQERLARECDVSILDSPDMVHVMYCASGGLIGNLVRLLRSGVQNARMNRRPAVSRNDFVVPHWDKTDTESEIWVSLGV